MRRRVLLFALALLAVPLAGCMGPDAASPPEGAITFETIAQGDNSGIQDRETFHIRTATGWNDLWENHQSNRADGEDAPNVNFDEEHLLAVFKGQSPNGCHGAEIMNVTGQPDGAIQVHVEFYEQTGVACTEQITHPYHIVTIPRYDADVSFQTSDVQRPANGSAGGDDGAARSFQTLDKGPDSSIDDRAQRVIRTQEAWDNLWQNHSDDAQPSVDFDERMVIAIFKGESPNGCHHAEITNVTDTGSNLTVDGAYYNIEGQACTQQITYPFHIVETSTYDGPVHFDLEEETRTGSST